MQKRTPGNIYLLKLNISDLIQQGKRLSVADFY